MFSFAAKKTTAEMPSHFELIVDTELAALDDDDTPETAF
jgi:hypothetical protein